MQDLSSLKIDRSAKPSKSKRRRPGRASPWVLRVVVLLVLLGLALLFQRPVRQFIDRFRLPTVRVAVVQESHPAQVGAVQGTAANGHIVAFRRAALSADTPGRIVELNVTEGSVLKQGDVVARLYFQEYAAALARARADGSAAAAEVERALAALASTRATVERRERGEQVARSQVEEAVAQERLARARFDRTATLVTSGIRSQDDLDAAKAEFDGSQARVASARSQLQAAAAEVTDSRHLARVADASLRVAKAKVDAAKAAEEHAAATLDKTYVRAPFDGIVVLKDAEVGEVVSPNSQGGSNARGSVCTMVDFDSLEVQADVPETSLPSVRLGARAAIYLDAFPGRTYPGKVSRIWPTADRQKASVQVRVTFLKRDQDLRPDMGVRVVFLPDDAPPTATAPASPEILVPEEAILQIAGKPGVFVVERDEVRFREVEIGNRRAGQVTVKSGLNPGQRIVLSPPADLSDGSRVRIATQ